MTAQRAQRSADTSEVDSLDISRSYWDSDQLGDPSLFFAMISVMRLSRKMVEPVERVLRRHGLGLTSYLLLMSLELSAKGSMILGRLARELIVHPTTITLTMDRLEQDGLARKTPHETDGRATRATITRAGRTLARKVTKELAKERFGLGDLTREQTADLMATVTNAWRAAVDMSSAMSAQ